MSQASAQHETQKLAEAYREFDRGLRVRQAKVGAVLSLVLMPAGVSLDFFVYPHLTWSILQARLLTDVFLIPCFAILFMGFGRRYVKLLGNLWAVPPTWAICWMIYASEGVISPYYAGLNLIIIGACLLLPYTLKDAIFFCTFVLLSYSAACVLNLFAPPHLAVHHAEFQFGTLFNNLYFLSLTSIICSTACFYSSRRRFEDFRLRHELDLSNKQLAESYEQLSQIDKLKSAFFANISHELRTPLTLIISPLEEVLRGAALLPEKAREALDTARQNALRLLKLISDLLDIVRLEEGRAKLQHDPIDLAVFVPAMVDSIRHLATVKGLELTTAEPEGPLVVRGDHAGLEKVVLNILTNAIKFTPKGGTISVRCWSEQGSAMVEIEDSGIGIPQESLPHIFDRFHQVDGSSTRKYQGVGIGLALARDLVQQHGGRLVARSQLGKGTAFRIELPLDAAAPAAVPDVRAADAPDAIQEIYKAANRSVPLPTDAPVSLESTGSGAHLVLVVDDEPDMRRFLVSALAKDHTVIQAADGLAGLETARAKKPDLVLLDLMLPGMDGLDVCRALKSDPETKNIKVVLLTARVDEQSKLTALERGADDFLTKPFSTAELQTRLANLMRAGELEEQLRNRNVELETTIKKLQDTEVQLVQSEKMNALGKLSAGLLHEINNPLNFTMMALQVAEQEANGNAGLQDTLKDIGQGMTRIRGVISDLRAFAYPSKPGDLEAFRVEDALTTALRLTAHEIGDIPVEQTLAGAQVRGTKTQIVHVFMNLMVNSAHAIKARGGPGPKITIACAQKDGRIAISVRDNGTGVKESDIPKLCDPFFTTKDVGQGMGLGLSICHTIVKNHGGHIEITSQEGQWTQVTFDLPSAAAQAPKSKQSEETDDEPTTAFKQTPVVPRSAA